MTCFMKSKSSKAKLKRDIKHTSAKFEIFNLRVVPRN